jgi:hypothetical protein
LRRGGAARATPGGDAVPVQALQAPGEFAGFDQVNIGPLPREITGRLPRVYRPNQGCR